MKIEIPSKGVIKFLTKVQQGKRRDNIMSVCLTRDSKKIMNMLQVGSKVFVVGEIQTTKKEIRGKETFFESLIATNVGAK